MGNLPANLDESDSSFSARRFICIEVIRKNWRLPPPATLVLILFTLAAFIGQLFGGSSDWQRAVGIIPANVTEVQSVMLVGEGQMVPAWFTLWTYMFLHGGFFHLLTNMASLWVFGSLAEPIMGSLRFALTYLVFGVITGMAIVGIVPYWTNPMVGASGAICGILGSFLALQLSEKIRPGHHNVLFLLLEALSLFAVVAWYFTRSVPSVPDRASSAVWHLVPFLLAWYSVRTLKGLNTILRNSIS